MKPHPEMDQDTKKSLGRLLQDLIELASDLKEADPGHVFNRVHQYTRELKQICRELGIDVKAVERVVKENKQIWKSASKKMS